MVSSLCIKKYIMVGFFGLGFFGGVFVVCLFLLKVIQRPAH